MIPNKSSFKFQELTPITGVKPYVIRYWETEFEEINPVISDSGQKIYTRKDIEAIFKIKKLLFDDRLSIPEAKLRMVSAEEKEIFISEKIPETKSLDVSEIKNKISNMLATIQEIKSKRNW